ncbi:MAG: pyridoxal phosphate-dependent aminotransferase [Firmicutes bacterium]|nr:pyridoxal phosphate-dependent aminotransferase [Bacillota bacterium]
MISRKMSYLAKNGSAIRAMFEEGKEMAAKFGRENVYDFSLGNPNTPAPEIIRESAIQILNEMDPVFLHGYMSNVGYENVRDSIAADLNRRFGTSYERKHLIMTVGAAGAMNIALKTLLDAGDEVVIQAPYFGEYNNYISNFDGVPVIISPREEDFSLNLSEMEQKIGPKTKALILNSPNNPTGVIYPEKDIIALADLLRTKQKEYGHAIYLISDEPYREIVFGNYEVPHLPDYYENTFVGYSYSKSLSLAGERIGYLLISPQMEDLDAVIGAAGVANRILGFVNAPSLIQQVVARCADQTSDMGVYIRNREILYRELTAYGYQMVEPKGAFYMFPKCPIPDDKAFCQAAKKYRILIVPGSTFMGPGYFRVAFCVSEKTVLDSLEGFRLLAHEYGMN